ncbi:Uncharacterized protein PBTT_02682 [Plasmodiophora brassicae]
MRTYLVVLAVVVVGIAAAHRNATGGGGGPAIVDARRASMSSSVGWAGGGRVRVTKKKSAPALMQQATPVQKFKNKVDRAFLSMFVDGPPAGDDAWLGSMMKRSVIEARDVGWMVLERTRAVDEAEQVRLGDPSYRINKVISLAYASPGADQYGKVVGFNAALRHVLNYGVRAIRLQANIAPMRVVLASRSLTMPQAFPLGAGMMPARTMSYPRNYAPDPARPYMNISMCAEDHVEWYCNAVRPSTPVFYTTVQHGVGSAGNHKFKTFQQCAKCHQAWSRRALTDYVADEEVLGTVDLFDPVVIPNGTCLAERADQLLHVDRMRHVHKAKCDKLGGRCVWKNVDAGQEPHGYEHRSIRKRGRATSA